MGDRLHLRRRCEVRNASSLARGRRRARRPRSLAVSSTTSARVTPARQPDDSGRRDADAPSSTTNTLVPVPSHRLPTVLAKIASSAPRSWAQARATTFSPYDVVFTPASAPRSLRGHGTDDDIGGRRPRRERRAGDEDRAHPRCPGSEPSGADAAGDGDCGRARSRCSLAATTSSIACSKQVDVTGVGRPESARPTRRAGRGDGERRTARPS